MMKKFLVAAVGLMALMASPASAQADFGTIIGGAAGGYLGDSVGNGKPLPIIAGTLLGALVGNRLSQPQYPQQQYYGSNQNAQGFGQITGGPQGYQGYQSTQWQQPQQWPQQQWQQPQYPQQQWPQQQWQQQSQLPLMGQQMLCQPVRQQNQQPGQQILLACRPIEQDYDTRQQYR